MEKHKNNTMILDTETVGDFESPLVHDLGYTIVDKHNKIIAQKRFLIRETRACKAVLLTEFYRRKASLYDSAIEMGTVRVYPWGTVKRILLDDMKRYKVKQVAAYNLAYDYKAINFTDKFFSGMKKSKIIEAFKRRDLVCLWGLTVDTIGQTEQYYNFCLENDRVTEAGNIRTDAETVYRFAICPDFVEEHTALDDAIAETEIYLHILKNYTGKIRKGLQYNVWKRAQR